MNDIYSIKAKLVQEKLERAKVSRNQLMERDNKNQQIYEKDQVIIERLEKEISCLEDQLYLLAEKNYLKREIWKKNLFRPALLAFFTMLFLAIGPMFPASAVVINFILVLLGIGTIGASIYYGKNIFYDLKEINSQTNGVSIQFVHNEIRCRKNLIGAKEEEQRKAREDMLEIEKKLVSINHIITELERILEVLEQEREKAIDEYLSKLPGLQDYLDQSFQNSQSITPYKRVLQLMGED